MADSKTEIEKNENRFEVATGIIIAFFAAVLALTSLGGGNTSKGQMVCQTEKGSAYELYNAKSIKASIVYGQKDSLESLLRSGIIGKEHTKDIEQQVETLTKSAQRYNAAGQEILDGSKLTALQKIEVQAFENEILGKLSEKADRDYVSSFYQKDKENQFYVLKGKVDFREVDRLFSVAVTKTGYKSPRWVQDLNGEYGVLIGGNEWFDKSNAIAAADSLFDMASLFLQLYLVIGAISIVFKRKLMKHLFFGGLLFFGGIGSIYTICGFVASAGLV